METIEYWINHPLQTDTNFCKVYAQYHRLKHHHYYLACLFEIEKNF